MAGRVDRWKIEVVQRYLEDAFLEVTVEHTPRGSGTAEHFAVEGRARHTEPRRVLHQLWIARSFFDRFDAPGALRDALASADVAVTLKRHGDRILELY